MSTQQIPNPAGKATDRITRLPSDLVNQIAAGEVVERPANLIKELVENSLDAGALRIEVHLIEGGLKELTVIDDGCGIVEEDLPLAVERHTTSKLKALQDLENISTFGFRGEALSSIASVSDFSIRSRPEHSERGVSFHLPYGENPVLKPVGCPTGTQVSVKDLFSRIPARFKFLRSQSTELSHCAKTFKELALGNPEVSFFLHHNGRLLSKYTSHSRLDRLKECLKPDWEPCYFQDSIEEMKYEAFFSPPDWAQPRGELIIFINQRPVKNRLLVSSIKNSFLEILGPNLEPSGVFYLDIRGDWVDVNVHPQKLEVRFYRQERIYSWLLSSLRKQLTEFKKHYPSTFSDERSSTLVNTTLELPSSQSWGPRGFESSTPFRFLSVVRSHYLILENHEGLFILNGKAYEERSLFLKLQKEIELDGIKRLTLPVAVILTLTEIALSKFHELSSLFSRLGFELELFGDRDVAIKAVPSSFAESAIKDKFNHLIEQLLALPSFVTEEQKKEKALTLLAQMGAQTKDFSKNLEAGQLLLNSITDLNETWTCPQGNPVLFKISWDQLEHYFKHL